MIVSLSRILRKSAKVALGAAGQDVFLFHKKGFCNCCDSKTTFIAFDSNLRDQFFCQSCYSIPRQRAFMKIIDDLYPQWRNLNIHESSPNIKGCSVSRKLQENCKGYIPTQYFVNRTLGEVIDGFRNEDLTRQTFGDGVFDLVLSQDVMEHVFSPEKAFAEIARTLRPGGAHIFTVPLVNKHRPTERWATLNDNGEVEFLHHPEFHGNPIDPNGSPVSMHWGYDITRIIDAAGPTVSEIVHVDDLDLGIRADLIEVVVSRRV
jgi:hypothetical protein